MRYTVMSDDFDYASALGTGKFTTAADEDAERVKTAQARTEALGIAPDTEFMEAVARIRGEKARPTRTKGVIDYEEARGGEGVIPHAMRNVALGALRAENAAESPAFLMGAAEAFQGPAQIGLEALESLGVVDSSTVESFNQMTEENRRFVTEQLAREYGDDFISSAVMAVSRGIGRAAPEIATLPLGSGVAGTAGQIAKIVPQGTGVLKSAARVGLGSAAGATGAGLEFVEEGEDRITNAALGSALGFGASSLIEVPHMVRSGIRRFLQGKIDEVLGNLRTSAAPDSPRSRSQKQALDNAEEAKRLQVEVPGLVLVPDQIMPDANVEATMRLAKKSSTIQNDLRFIYDQQPEAIKNYVYGMVDKLKESAPQARFGKKVKDAFDSLMGSSGTKRKPGTGLVGKRSIDARRDFERASSVGGNQPVIKSDNLAAEIDDIVAESQRRTVMPGSEEEIIGKRLDGLRLKLGISEETGGIRVDGLPTPLTPMEMQDLLATYGEGSSGLWNDLSKAAQKRISKRLFGAAKDDLTAAIKAGVPGANELRIARDNYTINSAKIKEVQDSMLGRLLGKKADTQDWDIEKAFLNADPEGLETAMHMLESSNPELRQSLQAFWLEDALTKSLRGGPAGAAEDVVRVIPGKLLDMVKGKNALRLDKVFPGGAEAVNVKRLLQAAAAVINNNNRTGGMTTTRLKDLAGVLTSMDNTFLARTAADLFAPPMLAKWAMGGPRVAKALTTFSEPFTNQQAFASLGVLGEYLKSEWPETAEEMMEPEDGN
jgi:hypothetical protein